MSHALRTGHVAGSAVSPGEVDSFSVPLVEIVEEVARTDVFYLTLLRMLGCTADSGEAAGYFGDELEFGRETALLDLTQAVS